ncbi:MAG TPA: phosphatidate cytidylyltransferase [Phycisphaerae bacterium]|nr:phosphatidate cytidylyltransferase [Phycisphaerae bacterium]HRR85272.1 phosphatidate cytidylyltransferase [Phycisphaerae bacterium]
MLWQRIAFGTLMIAVVVGLAWLDGWLSACGLTSLDEGVLGGATRIRLMCGLALTLALALLIMLAVFEMGRLSRQGGHNPATNWAAFVSVLLMLAPWIEAQQKLSSAVPALRLTGGMPLSLFLLTGGILGASLCILARKTTERAFSNLAVTCLMMLYLGLLGSFVIRIRCLDAGPAGAALVIFFILTVKAADIGAYFTGIACGKHKLAPWVSPGKTIEGAAGAVVLAAFAACAAIWLWECCLDSTLGPPPFSLAQAVIFGLVTAVCGHLGDLVESLMKRDLGSKDSGQVVPAFGGLLDILDSPVFTAPIAWWLLTFFGRIG